MSVIAAGTPCPEFTLTTEDGEPSRARTCAARRRVLVFYPFAFSPVCTDQLTLYEEVLDESPRRARRSTRLDRRAVVAGGVQGEARHHHRAAQRLRAQGRDRRAFGVAPARAGSPQRALVIVDPDGTVSGADLAATPGDLPGANLIFDGLAGAAA